MQLQSNKQHKRTRITQSTQATLTYTTREHEKSWRAWLGILVMDRGPCPFVQKLHLVGLKPTMDFPT